CQDVPPPDAVIQWHHVPVEHSQLADWRRLCGILVLMSEQVHRGATRQVPYATGFVVSIRLPQLSGNVRCAAIYMLHIHLRKVLRRRHGLPKFEYRLRLETTDREEWREADGHAVANVA